MTVSAVAEVWLWGGRVGAVAEHDDRTIVFEYTPEFRRGGLEVSPIHLPLSTEGPVSFPELGRRPGFNGLPGLLADALPDAFGNAVIRAYYMARGQEALALSPVQKLLYVGDRAMGALTFRPAVELPSRPAEEEALEVAALVGASRRVIEGDPDVMVPEIYRVGASAGGMRPKAVVLYDRARGILRSGFAERSPGDVPCLLKFDGVGDDLTQARLGGPQPFNRIEAAYAHMARTAGIEMAEVEILPGCEPHAHLLVRRFDRRDGERLHQHSLGGLLHVDFNDIGASSYEEYLRAILRLGLPPAAVDEGYRRMVFNVLAVNQDDHVKNLSFLMQPDGTWRLTPAYDVTIARGHGWTSTHQMRVADKLSGVTRHDLLGVARTFGVKRPERVVEQVRHGVDQWPKAAREAGVDADHVERIQLELDRRWRELSQGARVA
jgi:serine/threonine-protein kinase HipA